MIATSIATSTNPNDLLDRFHADCNLRGMVTTMDYIYRMYSPEIISQPLKS